MGERPFTADDLIRIFEEHLDPDEQDQVTIFFRPEVDINVAILRRILDLLLALVSTLTSPTIGFLISVFPSAVILLYNEAIDELARTNRALFNIIGSIDA